MSLVESRQSTAEKKIEEASGRDKLDRTEHDWYENASRTRTVRKGHDLSL